MLEQFGEGRNRILGLEFLVCQGPGRGTAELKIRTAEKLDQHGDRRFGLGANLRQGLGRRKPDAFLFVAQRLHKVRDGLFGISAHLSQDIGGLRAEPRVLPLIAKQSPQGWRRRLGMRSDRLQDAQGAYASNHFRASRPLERLFGRLGVSRHLLERFQGLEPCLGLRAPAQGDPIAERLALVFGPLIGNVLLGPPQ